MRLLDGSELHQPACDDELALAQISANQRWSVVVLVDGQPVYIPAYVTLLVVVPQLAVGLDMLATRELLDEGKVASVPGKSGRPQPMPASASEGHWG